MSNHGPEYDIFKATQLSEQRLDWLYQKQLESNSPIDVGHYSGFRDAILTFGGKITINQHGNHKIVGIIIKGKEKYKNGRSIN